MNCIIIPVYYTEPNVLDRFSINSLMNNLEDIDEYDIHYVCPTDLDTTQWKELTTRGKSVAFDTFGNSYFLSTISYSSLLMKYEFWKTYFNYDYALLYQTDGYCFGGNLSEFIQEGYDYIGAPIVATNARWFCTPCVGNGGVSLRKIATMLETTDPDGEFMTECKEDIEKHNQQNSDMYSVYEDLYFAQLVPMLWEFKKAPVERAYEFSYDMNTDVVYEKTGGKIPVFCHAFDKNIRFWQNISDAFKNPTIISACEWKNRTGYFDNTINYQSYLPHKVIIPGAVVCVKKENWRLEKTIQHLISCGFKKIVIVDNNEMSGEKPINCLTSIYRDVDIEVVDKFRGKRCEKDYDLLSEMYSYAYEHYCNELTHVMFIDADEELVFENKDLTICDVIDKMEESGFTEMHIPCYDADQYGNINSKVERKKVKTLMGTNMHVVTFTREIPVINAKCCDNKYTEVDSKSAHYTTDDKSNIYVLNHPTGTREEFDEHKMFKGWPDKLYTNRKKECNESYFYLFNNKNSTISIE